MINEANTGFMLLAASLVMLMTPGLAFFYGGLVGRSNTLTIMMQSFASMGITTVMWWLVGYSLCFSGGSNGVYGNFDLAFLRGVTPNTIYAPSGIPLVVFIAYQMMFAIITPALITGAFTNRVTFKAYLIFLVVWQLFVYYPFVHMFWGDGFLAHWGARDFAGGIVVHATAGWAALASVLYVGRRRFVDAPHNIPFIALGTGLLWFGWYGFNAGSELKVDGITATAFLNTDIAASFAATTWLFIEWRHARKPHFVGLLTGAVAGLATITPAAGYVPIYASVLIGIAAGGVCYVAVQVKNRRMWDDALDVWGVHGVGGFLHVVVVVDGGRRERHVFVVERPEGGHLSAGEVDRLAHDEIRELVEFDRRPERLGEVVEVGQPLDGVQHADRLAPRIAGTFFTVDLARVRAAFEAAPWVRRAVVHREFPNRLRVTLQEHEPVALWSGEGGQGDARLVNSFGEVFEANLGEVDQDGLPMLSGPDGQSAEVLAMYRVVAPAFAEMDMAIEQLALSGRGSWSVRLEAGAEIELGRGNPDEVTPRVDRFLKTLTQVVSRYGRAANAIESADLRHENGYAIRLRGVSTTQTDPAKK